MMALYHTDCFLSTERIVVLYCFPENALHYFSLCLAQHLHNMSNKCKRLFEETAFLFPIYTW